MTGRDFLRFNERAVLPNAGGMSREDADRLAHEEYARFEERRRLEAERVGEADVMKALEHTARDVERVKKSSPARGKRGGE